MNKKLLHTYTNGDWDISIFEDGTKIRSAEIVNPNIKFPESMDVKINSWCNAGCAWCHENSTTKGEKSPNLDRIIELYSQLPKGVEIAIGGGHPLAHDQFDYFVEALSSFGINCNVTVNEFHFESERKRIERLISKGFLKGVGYSYSKIPLNWDYEHAVTHVIAGVTPYGELNRITERNNGKVLLLGYKNFRRGSKYINTREKQINATIMSWYRNLFQAVREAKISFDNLAIEQLNPRRLMMKQSDYDMLYMGADGSHTCYIDACEGKIAKSSTSVIRHDIHDGSLVELFNLVKI